MTRRRRRKDHHMALGIPIGIGATAALLGLAILGGRWLSTAEPDDEPSGGDRR